MTDALEEALLHVWQRLWPGVRRHVDILLERTADVLRPHPPLYLRTLEGETVTGIVVLEKGQAVVLLGILHRVSAPNRQRDPFRHDEAPLWARDVDDRDLRDLDVDPYRRR